MENPAANQLISLIQKGDIKAFDLFYKNNWRKLYHHAYQATGSIDDSKDLVQNVFINFWMARDSIDPVKFHTSYLFTSLKNGIINLHKKTEVRRLYTDLQAEEYASYTNEDQYIAKELAQTLQTRVDQLPGKMQQVFVLSRYKNLSISEISETLNITPRTVKNQLSTALKILRTNIGVTVVFYFFSK